MSDFNLTTSVAFIIFNRPETTKKVFDAIKQAKPKKLFIIADGPRLDKPGENEKCLKTRTITNNIDWDCEVLRNYSEINLGCRKRVSSGIDWLFENVEEAIILEDDCLPHPSFFRYCQELLDRYRNEKKVMMISGTRFLEKPMLPQSSYYYSNFTHVWGWATWRRAWQLYDVEMKVWDSIKKSNFIKGFSNSLEASLFWKFNFNETYNGFIDTWDNQWLFCCLINKGLTIIPTNNLISNIGFGTEGTHTKNIDSFGSNLLLEEMKFPLIHPDKIKVYTHADDHEERIHHRLDTKSKMKHILKSIGLGFLFRRN